MGRAWYSALHRPPVVLDLFHNCTLFTLFSKKFSPCFRGSEPPRSFCPGCRGPSALRGFCRPGVARSTPHSTQLARAIAGTGDVDCAARQLAGETLGATSQRNRKERGRFGPHADLPAGPSPRGLAGEIALSGKGKSRIEAVQRRRQDHTGELLASLHGVQLEALARHVLHSFPFKTEFLCSRNFRRLKAPPVRSPAVKSLADIETESRL